MKEFLLFLIVLTESALAQPNEYRKGWIADVEFIDSASTVRVGSYVETENPYRLDIHRRDENFSFLQKTPAIKHEGYFEAKRDGFYTFIADISIPAAQYMHDRGITEGEISCTYSMFLEGKEVLSFNSGILRSVEPQTVQVVGNHDLKKGLFRAKQFINCRGYRNTTNKWGLIQFFSYPRNTKMAGKYLKMKRDPAEEVTFTLMVREPKSMTPRLIESKDFVHAVS